MLNTFKILADEIEDPGFNFNINDPLSAAVMVVGALIILIGIVSFVTSIVLSVSYIKYNRRKNSKEITGQEAAREILDRNGLEKIKVKCTGSLLFGNSYSHYFHKVRLRRLTYKKKSITSLAMAAEKSSLAILDKEGDKDMKARIVTLPIVTFGPYAFIPLIIVGVLIDILLFNTIGISTVITAVLGLAFLILSFVLTILELKTEVKAQNKACEILNEYGMATEDEIESMRKLFKLYNIEYVNNVIMAFLEIVYRILMILLRAKGSSSSSSNNN